MPEAMSWAHRRSAIAVLWEGWGLSPLALAGTYATAVGYVIPGFCSSRPGSEQCCDLFHVLWLTLAGQMKLQQHGFSEA